MRLSDFYYDLPAELIAQYPTEERGASRLLCLDGRSGDMSDRQFADLPSLLQPGDLLVFNNTRVIRARLYGQKQTGGKVEILVERVLSPHRALAQIRASHSPRTGSLVQVGSHQLQILGRQQDLFEIESRDLAFHDLMDSDGHMPLPPYIARGDLPIDEQRYQTVYAEKDGAVAAPTAGLHFDEKMLTRLEEQGVTRATVTLHVGAGTFQPVRVDNLDEHRMHQEWLEVDQSVCDAIRDTKSRGHRVVAIGTTSVRALESAAQSGQIQPFQGETRLFITPGYQFNVVDALLTNFHLPESTLLMLVSAFAGYDAVMSAYQHAIQKGYRFFSYGDAMWLTRG